VVLVAQGRTSQVSWEKALGLPTRVEVVEVLEPQVVVLVVLVVVVTRDATVPLELLVPQTLAVVVAVPGTRPLTLVVQELFMFDGR
jgi:hypothetical protein